MDSASPQPDTTPETPEPGQAGELTTSDSADLTATPNPPDQDPPGHKLRPTQKRFAELVAIGTPRQAAYAQAYPKAMASTCRRESGQLVRNPRVLRYIEHLRASGLADAELSVADITNALKRIAFFDITKISDESGELLPLSKWPKDAGAIVQGITAKTANSNGQPKLPDRIQALRTLAEMRGALGQGVGSREKQPPATFVFNFGGGKAKPARPKVVSGERLADQDDLAQIGPVPARLVDKERAA